MTRMRRLMSAIVLGSAVMLAAACSSSSSTSSAPSSAPSTAQPASGATSTASSPQAAGPASCATAELRVTVGTSQGAAGSIYLTIDFTSTGSASCTLHGYPGVSLAGGNPPAQIGAPAARSTATAPKLVTLAPGAVASALLQVTQAGNYPAATCGPSPATTLVIYPPNQKASASVPYRTTGCSAQQITILHVGPVQAGSGG